jgi:hypothetical protein
MLFFPHSLTLYPTVRAIRTIRTSRNDMKKPSSEWYLVASLQQTRISSPLPVSKCAWIYYQTACTKRKETTGKNGESIEHLPLILIEWLGFIQFLSFNLRQASRMSADRLRWLHGAKLTAHVMLLFSLNSSMFACDFKIFYFILEFDPIVFPHVT